MPKELHVFKEGQFTKQKRQRPGLLVFSDLPCLFGLKFIPIGFPLPVIFISTTAAGANYKL
jgi:hypothetical protein